MPRNARSLLCTGAWPGHVGQPVAGPRAPARGTSSAGCPGSLRGRLGRLAACPAALCSPSFAPRRAGPLRFGCPPHCPAPAPGLAAPSTRREGRAKLSVCSKLCYAVGGAPYQTTGCVLGFFLQIYLLDVAQLDPFSASIILFVGRAWDAVTDPMVGFFISKTSWSRFGRLMPW
uniref:Uncharacterized protein n=1 Tax=Nothoprocta perdicaria TaxID=30464 RepID=A0A8C7EDT4_NOTPE